MREGGWLHCLVAPPLPYARLWGPCRGQETGLLHTLIMLYRRLSPAISSHREDTLEPPRPARDWRLSQSPEVWTVIVRGQEEEREKGGEGDFTLEKKLFNGDFDISKKIKVNNYFFELHRSQNNSQDISPALPQRRGEERRGEERRGVIIITGRGIALW